MLAIKVKIGVNNTQDRASKGKKGQKSPKNMAVKSMVVIKALMDEVEGVSARLIELEQYIDHITPDVEICSLQTMRKPPPQKLILEAK